MAAHTMGLPSGLLDDIDLVIRQDARELIERIEQGLASEHLSKSAYRELGKLLEQVPHLELTNDRMLMPMMQLAVSLLLPTEATPKDDQSPAMSMAERVALARDIRKRIAREISIYRNPLVAVLSAAGSPAAQLISGLTWFTITITVLIGSTTAARMFLSNQYNIGYQHGIRQAQPVAETTVEPDANNSIVIDGESSGSTAIDDGESQGSQVELFSSQEWQYIQLVLAAGGLGSIVSVMLRSRKLENRNRSQSMLPFFIGFFKPVVGTAFGLLAVALIESEVVILSGFNPSEADTQSKYLYFAIAFIAGFSEVLVPDFLARTEKTMSPSESHQTEDIA
ncbi:hypothetical protein [Leptothoe kymatousa]|uniref:Uncharacterized protein n=1 Tax=Leptothoe kymatousa TAU-MAC 1615 TaxID=2364775 RepID=A0ABS5XYY1_9CYAN|nr:hypothetical protein [Leptothoe kymatousa]MBT9310811.1 hypothetical protein [Leptothoe kymatousa TAU-MAC 1615]